MLTIRGNGTTYLRNLDIEDGDNPNGQGGGIDWRGGGILDIADTDIVNNVAGYGGGIYAQGSNTISEVVVGDSGQFRFNVFARNGQIVLSSETYMIEASAFNGAFAVQSEGQNAASYAIHTSVNGGYYFTLSALNGEIIGVSQQYSTKAAASSAISSLKTLLPAITIL